MALTEISVSCTELWNHALNVGKHCGNTKKISWLLGLDTKDQAAVIGKCDQSREALPVISEHSVWLRDELEPTFWENSLSCFKPSSRGFNRFPSAICSHHWLPSLLKMFFLLQVYILLPRRVKLQLQILPICDKESPPMWATQRSSFISYL